MAKFTTRHYQEMARVFRNTMPAEAGLQEDTWRFIRDKFIALFEADNPRFKRDKFIEATLSPSGPYRSLPKK